MIRQENRYLGAARNAAVAAARGEWLLFLDDDNVLFPDAVSRLVRAARFSGADCVPAASIRFFGNGDPWTDTASRGTPRRFLGTARAWSRLRNVVGDACALVRREAFEAVGGFTEEYRVGLDDLSFFNSLIQAGYRIEPMPDPAYYYRIADTSMRSRNRSAEAERVRVLAPYVKGLPAEERALADFTISQTMDTINLAGSQPFRGVRARRTAILVSGMHRSGTSALTRVLNILGCDLPKTLTKPKSDNVAGFWESRAITDLNDEILASAGSSWDDWLPFDQSWHHLTHSRQVSRARPQARRRRVWQQSIACAERPPDMPVAAVLDRDCRGIWRPASRRPAHSKSIRRRFVPAGPQPTSTPSPGN